MEPQILSSYNPGEHNANLEKTISRLEKSASAKDQSTVLIVPAFGSVPTKAVASWLSLYFPPNQKIVRLFALGMEVGKAYSSCIANVLAHEELSKFKYVVTLEHDNIPPPDGLVRLLESMEANPQFDAIGGLYYTKGPGGCAQIWGDATPGVPLNFRPQVPDPKGGLVECCGTANGFNAFKLSMFKDEKLRRPWFQTTSDMKNGSYTQDLYFWTDARKHGYRCAIDCSIKVGHYDLASDFVW